MTPPAPAARPPRPRSTRGPVGLAVAGVLLVLAAVVVAALVARGMAGMLPTDLLGADGKPASGVIGVVDVPGTARMDLDADTDYAVYLAMQQPPTDAVLADDVRVQAPDGRVTHASSPPGVSVRTTRGPTTAWTVGAFETDEAGTYTLTAPAVRGGGDALVLVATDQPVLPFVTGVFGTVLGVFVAIGLALAGVPMAVLGIVWWQRRAAELRGVPAAEPAEGAR